MFDIADSKLKSAVLDVANLAASIRARAFIVGGAVRDYLLGFQPKDFDIEVFGADFETLKNIISSKYKFKECGVSFGVLKLNDFEIDITLPRRESKCGIGHRAFLIEGDPNLSIEEASLRRDFTINAIYLDPLTGEILDPHNGRVDLEKKILRHVSEKFVEDPLRVLRGMQFVARFSLTPSNETVEICKTVSIENLARERIFGEWSKLLLKGVSISSALEFIRSTGWIKYFPQLQKLIGCKQEPKWHPEGDVWEHTKCCLDAFAKNRVGEEKEDLVVGLAVLCHDFGKPLCTRYDESKGRIVSRGHDELGVKPARAFLEAMTNEQKLIEEVLQLVRCHMRPFSMWKSKAQDGAVKRLSCQVSSIERLLRVCQADDLGRPPFPSKEEPILWLREKAEKLKVISESPKMIFLGRHLISLGLKPNPRFKGILEKMYAHQLDGEFSDLPSAIEFFNNHKSDLL